MGGCLSKSEEKPPGMPPIPREDSHPSRVAYGGENQQSPDVQLPSNPMDKVIADQQNAGKTVVRAIYDFDMTQPGDLPFRKGDVMVILKEEGEWMEAQHLVNKKVGYVPSTYVMIEKSLPSYDWYHDDIPRPEAESRLLTPENQPGTFLIRLSKTGVGSSYSLSILDETPDRRLVRHYRIKSTDSGSFFISPKNVFPTIVKLVEFYAGPTAIMCCRLTTPCGKPNPMLLEMSRELKDKWEVPRSEIKLQGEIGKGNFGSVFKGVWKGCRMVAVKTLREGTMSKEKFLEEAAAMKKLRHPKIVSLYAVCSREEPIYIITELMSNGSLLEYLRVPKGSALTLTQLLDIGAQVADGMRYIESKNFIHRDLAARNILVGDCNSVKIGDFGLAKFLADNEDQNIYSASKGSKFPIKWTAPEAAIYGQFTIKSDVWAYGILLVELLTRGAMPYPGLSNAEVLEQVQRGYRHPEPVECPKTLYEKVLLICWHKDVERRPTFEFLYYIMNDLAVGLEPNYEG